MPDPKGPDSPDSLGVHGRVEGVTRIGPRALLIGVLIIVALVGGVLYGLNSGKQTQQAQIQSLPPTAAPQVTDQAHFGEDVPIVETPPPETAPPPVLLPPSPPPANTPAPATAAPASILPTGPSPAQVAEEKRADAERQRELDEEKARAEPGRGVGRETQDEPSRISRRIAGQRRGSERGSRAGISHQR